MTKQKTIFTVMTDGYIWSDKFKTLEAAQNHALQEADGYAVIQIYECKKVAEAKVRSKLEWK